VEHRLEGGNFKVYVEEIAVRMWVWWG